MDFSWICISLPHHQTSPAECKERQTLGRTDWQELRSGAELWCVGTIQALPTYQLSKEPTQRLSGIKCARQKEGGLLDGELAIMDVSDTFVPLLRM